MGKRDKDFNRKYIPFYDSFEKTIDKLENETEQLDLYRAIVRFGLYGEEPKRLTGLANLLWEAFRPTIEKSRNRAISGSQAGNREGNTNALKKKREHTIKPPKTIEEFDEYCFVKGYDIDTECFMSYYESIGWVTQHYKIHNWMQAADVWYETKVRNGYKN